MSEKEIRKKQRKERKILLLLCIPLKTDNTITIMDTFQAVDIDSLLLDISLRENREAFRQLFECCYAPLCLYAKRFIDDFDTREDIVQEVFFQLWEKRKSIYLTGSARSYLITAVKNHCLNHLKRKACQTAYEQKMTEQAPAYANKTEEIYSLAELTAMLQAALEKLPLEYRIAFEMNRLEGHSLEEVASALHVSTRTVERYRDKATQLLEHELKEFLPLLLALLACGR